VTERNRDPKRRCFKVNRGHVSVRGIAAAALKRDHDSFAKRNHGSLLVAASDVARHHLGIVGEGGNRWGRRTLSGIGWNIVVKGIISGSSLLVFTTSECLAENGDSELI